MLRVLGSPRRLCDAVSRRELITAGGIGLFGGMTLPNLVQAETLAAEQAGQARRSGWVKPGKAKSVILLYLMGWPPQGQRRPQRLRPDSRRLNIPGRKRLEIDYGQPIREILT